ncbi:CARDB domain-containing protein [Pelagibius marinus]|uniref:CARDB domain-containing protein n=1 Tax=Pelagibius marinus TaxID=2762760 RepID=UPI0018723DD0|nr:CARDB domain-containing protein [Pelagibius marinus]
MAKRLSLGLFAAASLCTAVSLAAGAGQALAQPDLVPQLNFPMNASVGVLNSGTTAAGPSQLTINCTRFGQADGGCPEAPGMGAYVDPAFPNRAVIDVPALEPGEAFNHDLTFWNAIPWTPGTFVFDAEVDAGGDVVESDETNNSAQSSYTELPAVGVAPPAPLPLTAQPAAARPVRPSQLDSANIFRLRKQRSSMEHQVRPQRLAPRQPEEPKRPLLRRPAD